MKVVNFNGITKDIRDGGDKNNLLFSRNDICSNDKIKIALKEVQLLSSIVHPYIV